MTCVHFLYDCSLGGEMKETDLLAKGGIPGAADDWAEAGGAGGDGLDEDMASLGAADGEWKDDFDIGVDDAAISAVGAGAAGAHGHLNGGPGEAHDDAPGADPTAAWRQKPIPADLIAAGMPVNTFTCCWCDEAQSFIKYLYVQMRKIRLFSAAFL